MDNNMLRFQFASLLSRSPIRDDREEALIHLGYLVTNSGEYHRDALYLLAVTKYLLEDYENGRACAEELLRLEPDNHQVSERHRCSMLQMLRLSSSCMVGEKLIFGVEVQA